MSASAEFLVDRNHWGGSGCLGSVSYQQDGDTHAGIGGVSPEGIVGRRLGAGTRIRVTVEVLEDAPLPTVCQRPRDDIHKAHIPGPDLVAADGTRWFWSEPDGVGGTRPIEFERTTGPRRGEVYREYAYSAGYRQYGQPPERKPRARWWIEHHHGDVVEVASAAPLPEGVES